LTDSISSDDFFVISTKNNFAEEQSFSDFFNVKVFINLQSLNTFKKIETFDPVNIYTSYNESINPIDKADVLSFSGILTFGEQESASDRISFKVSPYIDLVTFLTSQGVPNVILLRDIKSYRYNNSNSCIIVPRNLNVIEVWNGYIMHYEVELILGAINILQFKQLLELLEDALNVPKDSNNVFLIDVIGERLDTTVKGFYREFLKVKFTEFFPLE
jgi:hypothetical protein